MVGKSEMILMRNSSAVVFTAPSLRSHRGGRLSVDQPRGCPVYSLVSFSAWWENSSWEVQRRTRRGSMSQEEGDPEKVGETHIERQ